MPEEEKTNGLEPPIDPVAIPGEQRTWLQKNLRPLVGLVTVLSCFALYMFITVHVLHSGCEGGEKDLLLIILGALPGILSYVLQFCFGGSQATERKQELQKKS
jgi:hypothetical protein